MANGFWMKALRVNLTDGTLSDEALDESLLKKLIGGAGMGAHYLYQEVPASVNPLDEANLLLFTTGPYQATKLPGSAKFSIVSRSPLTGGFMDTAAGGSFGHRLKQSGYDFLVISGKSASPVYLLVDEGNAQLVPADGLWGRDSFETCEHIQASYPGTSVAAIGKAGEHQVACACVYVDCYSAAGRGGLGAVMGSKLLKAVAVRGSRFPEASDPAAQEELEKRHKKSITQISAPLREGGTVGGLVPGSEAGNLPVKNWSLSSWPGHAEKIGLPGYNDMLKPKLHPCLYCTVACHRSSDTDMPGGWHYRGPAPEYETLALLGGSCMIDDLELLVQANDYCNRMGIDTITAGSCAAFAMEALERGHTRGHLPDYSFNWGDGRGLLVFLEELVAKRGFGGLFSQGIRKGAEHFDPEASAYACHVKGMDIPGHDPRVYYNMALNYATGNRGACHMRAYSQISTMGALLPEAGIDTAPAPDTLDGAAHVVKVYQDFAAFYNCTVMCQFMIWGGFSLQDMTDCINAVTGWNLTVQEIMEAGERVFTLQRMLNNRYGIGAADDTLPKRFFEASPDEPRKGKSPEPFADAMAELYRERGWDDQGRPTRQKVASLGLDTLLSNSGR